MLVGVKLGNSNTHFTKQLYVVNQYILVLAEVSLLVMIVIINILLSIIQLIYQILIKYDY